MPPAVYDRANRDRAADMSELAEVRNDKVATDELKREISTALALVLAEEDVDSIPIIVEAARRAIDLSE